MTTPETCRPPRAPHGPLAVPTDDAFERGEPVADVSRDRCHVPRCRDRVQPGTFDFQARDDLDNRAAPVTGRATRRIDADGGR